MPTRKTGPKRPASQPATLGDVASVAPVDLDSLEAVAERRWSAVLKQWREGDPAPMAEWLRTHALALPQDAHEFLVALVQGNARPTDRRSLRKPPAWVDRAIMAAYWSALEAGIENDDAASEHIADLAIFRQRHTVRPVTVTYAKNTIKKLRLILTHDLWVRAGRPPWVD